jgi:nucleoside 2-deoxyribosyltransferase
MKIYFAGSIRGGRSDAPVYQALIKHLSIFGEVLTEHVGDVSLSQDGDDGPNDRNIYSRDMACLADCDLLVAEVSVPSLGVGYEVGYATARKKPVLCLHKPEAGGRLSAMIAGNPHIQVAEYDSMDKATRILTDFINQIRQSRMESDNLLT